MNTEFELLEAINLRSLPIDWRAVSELGHMLDELQDNNSRGNDLAEIKPPTDIYPVISMVASVVANKNNPSIPLYLPSREDIQKMRPYLITLERLIGKVSPRLSKKFGLYCEKTGQDLVKNAALGLVEVVEIFTPFERPREQFVKELTFLYINLQKPVVTEGFFFDDEIPIEEKIENFFDLLPEGDSDHWFNRRDFPLTTRLTKRLKFPPTSLSSSDAGVAWG